jgi:cytidine deaminase
MRRKLNDENRAMKGNIDSRKISIFSSFSSTKDDEIESIVSTCEEGRENDKCLYCRHFFSEDKRGQKYVHCTKCCE